VLDEVARGLADLLVERETGKWVYLDELYFHRRQPEMVHVGDPIPKRPALAGKRNPCGSESDHE